MLRSIYLLPVLAALAVTSASGQSLEERYWRALCEGRDLSKMHSVVERLAGPGRQVPPKPEFRADALRLLDRIEGTAPLGGLAVDSRGVRPQVGADWPSMGGNAAHTGTTTQAGPLSSEPVIRESVSKGGFVYATGSEGTLWALHLKGDQRVAWTYRVDGIYPASAVDAKKVYTGSWDGNYYAIDRGTGQIVWAFCRPGRPYSLG